MPPLGIATSTTIATIDMGSNSIHLLVSRWSHGQLESRYTAVERVRTALLMDEDLLTPAARDRALLCLRRFKAVAQRHGCSTIIAVGTSALRQARNPDYLLQPAEALLGSPVCVLSGIQEAEFIYRAVAARVGPGVERHLVVDVGGGSTELILGCRDRVLGLESLSLGCVSSFKRHFADGKLNLAGFTRCVDEARGLIAPLLQRWPGVAELPVFACSGSAGAVALVLGRSLLRLEKLYDLRDDMLAQFGTIDQLRFSPLAEDRCTLFAPGLAIMIALFEALEVDAMQTIDVALREGVALAFFKGQWRGDMAFHEGVPSGPHCLERESGAVRPSPGSIETGLMPADVVLLPSE